MWYVWLRAYYNADAKRLVIISGIYEKLEDIFGKLDDETEQFDEDEMGEMGDEHSAEPDGEQTETAGESAEAKEDDDDSIHGFNFGMNDLSFHSFIF